MGRRDAVGPHAPQPAPSARIRSIGIAEAVASPGVYAVLLADDVPGSRFYGLEFKDQPVLASDVVRYVGEPVALVAAEHPELARRAAEKIVVDYEPLPAVVDMRAGARTRRPAGASVRQRAARGARRARRPERGGRGLGRGLLRDRDAGSGAARARGRDGGARRGRWDRPVRRDAVAPHRPASSSPPASACPRTRSGCSWRGPAARSARARTSACRSTRACWRSTRAVRSRWRTGARSRSWATCTVTPPASGCGPARRATATSSTSAPGS